MSRTVVVGGGLSGLVHAWALAREGRDVTLVEAAPKPGGVVRTERRDGFLLETGPNTVRPTTELWRLVVELGLEKEALLASSRTPRFLDFQGSLQRLPMSPAALLSTPLLSARAKLRLLAEPFVTRGNGGPESVADFARRRLGSEVAERFVEPLIGGIYAGTASTLSVESAFPELVRWERDKGSLLRGSLESRRGRAPVRGLLSLRQGLAALPAALASALGERVRFGVRAERLERRGSEWLVRGTHGDLEAQQVVLASPAAEASRLVRPFLPGAADALDRIPHPSLDVLHLAWPADAFPRPPEGFGHLVVPAPSRRVLGVLYSSSLFPERAPQGEVLLTVFLGGARDPAAGALSEADLVEAARKDIASELSARGGPRVIAVTRYRRAIPQYDFEHAAMVAALEEAERALPGLRFLGNYRGGVSVGDVVRNALRI